MQTRILVAGAVIGFASLLAVRTEAQTAAVQTETKWVTVDGEVVRYEPGKVIVVRGMDNKEIAYTIAPNVTVPADVQIGHRVTIFTEPAADGSTQLVRRVSTVSVTPEGQTKRTTEITKTAPSGKSTTTTTSTISGKVEAYVPGKTLTIMGPNGKKVTYLITQKSQVPADLVIGKTVNVLPLTGLKQPTVETITVVTTEEVQK